MSQTISLDELLIACADLWATANQSSTATLGRRVANDNKFIAELAAGTRSPSLAKVEQFARFLHAAANWPGGLVPVEVCQLAHRVGVSANSAAPSAGKTCEGSSGVAA